MHVTTQRHRGGSNRSSPRHKSNTRTVLTKGASRKTAAPVGQAGWCRWLCSRHGGRDLHRCAGDWVTHKDEKQCLGLSGVSSGKTCCPLASLLSAFRMESFFRVGSCLVCLIVRVTFALFAGSTHLHPALIMKMPNIPWGTTHSSREAHCTIPNERVAVLHVLLVLRGR